MEHSNSTCLSGAIPVDLGKDSTCNLGFYCPNSDSNQRPQFCPPTKQCQTTRLLLIHNICSQPQGQYEPSLCAAGYYCPSGGKEQIQCPRGHYCPAGSHSPLACEGISLCSPGSASQKPITGLVVLIIIDIILILFATFPVIRKFLSKNGQRRSRSCGVKEEKELAEDLAVVRPQVKGYGYLQDFVQSSKRALGQNDAGMQIDCTGLGLKLSNGKELLSNVNAHVGPGSLLAVMGASGAGKSTLIRVLMGKMKATSGTIAINGIPHNMSEFKKIIGYVPQEDNVLPELTVRENILHSARIRLPTSWTKQELEVHVDMLLSCLQISHIQDRLVGDIVKPIISGGQRKRVSIGIELAAAPMVLILDEPTSGLDATSALSIVDTLKALSRLGVTVICIIHQPRQEIFLSLDRLLLLAGGREIFQGKPADAVPYFQRLGYVIPTGCNPADAIMDIASGQAHRYQGKASNGLLQTAGTLAARWQDHKGELTQMITVNEDGGVGADINQLSRSCASRGAPWISQSYYCLHRSIIQQSRKLVGFFLEIVVGAIAGLMIGLAVYKLDGLLFRGVYLSPFELLSSAVNYTLVPELALLNSLAIGLAAAAPGVKTFGEEKAIYWREAASGHSRSAYFVGKTLSTLPRLSLSALHFTVFYALLATPIMSFKELYAVHLLYFYCIYGLASGVSMVVSREDGPLLAMIVSLIIGIFGGYGPSLSTIKTWHLEWFWRMCPGTWISEAYFHAHTKPFGYLYDLDSAAVWTGYTLNRFNLDMSMLFVIGTVYRGMAFVGLIFMDRDKQV